MSPWTSVHTACKIDASIAKPPKRPSMSENTSPLYCATSAAIRRADEARHHAGGIPTREDSSRPGAYGTSVARPLKFREDPTPLRKLSPGVRGMR